MGMDVQRHIPAALLKKKDGLPIVWNAGWAPGPIWKGEENLAPKEIQFPVRQDRRQSLYRLSYPGPPDVNDTN
jgi:hypothetical protein